MTSLSLLAGNAASAGNLDGVGTEARFSAFSGVARDSAGNLYVADGYSVRKVSPAGVVSTLANLSPTANDLVGGLPSSAFTLNGVAVDAAGNVYVVDPGTVRKISPAGSVTTLAGVPGNLAAPVDGAAAVARFRFLLSITVDSGGNLYMVDNGAVRKLTQAGIVSTLAGADGVRGWSDGTGAAASFAGPAGIAVDSAGMLYVADTSAHTIRKVTPAGVVSTLAGTVGGLGSVDGTGGAARFSSPTGVAVDASGNVYIADQSGRVRKISPAAVVTSLGNGERSYSLCSVYQPGLKGIAVDDSGQAYVGDPTFGSALLRISATGASTVLAGGGLSRCPGTAADGLGAAASFANPLGLGLDPQGNAYVMDAATVRRVGADGLVSTTALQGDSGMAVDAAGAVYVGADTFIQSTPLFGFPVPSGGKVLRLASSGAVATVLTSSTVTPSRTVVDAVGNVYISDRMNYTVAKFAPSGELLKTWPTLTFTAPSRTSFGGRSELAVDANGNMFLADNNTVRKISPAGDITALAGAFGVAGMANGPGPAARFGDIGALALDAAGNLYVSDTSNHLVRKIDTSGTVSTVLGQAGAVGIRLGAQPGSLYQPQGLALDANGVLTVVSAGAVLRVKLAP